FALRNADRQMLVVAARVIAAMERVERIFFDGRGVFLFALAGAAVFLAGSVGHIGMVAVAKEHGAQALALDHAALGEQQFAVRGKDRERQWFADDDPILVHASAAHA